MYLAEKTKTVDTVPVNKTYLDMHNELCDYDIANDNLIRVTQHANRRIKERLHIKNMASRQKLANDAFQSGTRLTNCSHVEKSYIMSNINSPYSDNSNKEFILYRDNIYIFSNNNVLITVLPRDNKFAKKLEANRAKINRRLAQKDKYEKSENSKEIV